MEKKIHTFPFFHFEPLPKEGLRIFHTCPPRSGEVLKKNKFVFGYFSHRTFSELNSNRMSLNVNICHELLSNIKQANKDALDV